jgi:N6-adenosine-specific RNA methylase IME4
MLEPPYPFHQLASGGYGVILADPPWHFKGYTQDGGPKSPSAHYPCMSVDEIAALPVHTLAAPDCALIMWATAPMLPAALTLIDHWGFVFKTAGAWAKQSRTGNSLAFGTGYIFRSAAEFFLVATRGKPKVQSRSIRNLIVAPIREHSRKPDAMHANIEALYDGPYLEMFAREQREGWTAWGNDTTKFGGQHDDHGLPSAEAPDDGTGARQSRRESIRGTASEGSASTKAQIGNGKGAGVCSGNGAHQPTDDPARGHSAAGRGSAGQKKAALQPLDPLAAMTLVYLNERSQQ